MAKEERHAPLTNKIKLDWAPGEVREQPKDVRELIADAALAQEIFGDDELEAFIPPAERCTMCKGYGAIVISDMGRPCMCGGSGRKKDQDATQRDLDEELAAASLRKP